MDIFLSKVEKGPLKVEMGLQIQWQGRPEGRDTDIDDGGDQLA